MSWIAEALRKSQANVSEVITPNSQMGTSHRIAASAGLQESSNPDYQRTRQVQVDPIRLRSCGVFFHPESSSSANAYKMLRTKILQRMRVEGLKTLGVTSPGIGSGKTTTAINLSLSLARDVNQTVLLIDLDLKNPTVGQVLFEYVDSGIGDYLLDNLELSSLFVNPGLDRFVVVPGNTRFLNSSEILSSPKIMNLVKELRSRYEDRLIIFDLTSLSEGDDVIAFSPALDAILLVVEEGVTTKEDLNRTIALLKDRNIIGIVLNKTC